MGFDELDVGFDELDVGFDELEDVDVEELVGFDELGVGFDVFDGVGVEELVGFDELGVGFDALEDVDVEGLGDFDELDVGLDALEDFDGVSGFDESAFGMDAVVAFGAGLDEEPLDDFDEVPCVVRVDEPSTFDSSFTVEAGRVDVALFDPPAVDCCAGCAFGASFESPSFVRTVVLAGLDAGLSFRLESSPRLFSASSRLSCCVFTSGSRAGAPKAGVPRSPAMSAAATIQASRRVRAARPSRRAAVVLMNIGLPPLEAAALPRGGVASRAVCREHGSVGREHRGPRSKSSCRRSPVTAPPEDPERPRRSNPGCTQRKPGFRRKEACSRNPHQASTRPARHTAEQHKCLTRAVEERRATSHTGPMRRPSRASTKFRAQAPKLRPASTRGWATRSP